MKTLKRILMAVLSIAIYSHTAAQCPAAFRYYAGTDSLYFYDSLQVTGTYSWQFGDGTSSTLSNPAHAYNAPGQYQVCITVTDAGNTCSATFCDTVTISPCDIPANQMHITCSAVNTGFDISFTTTVTGGVPPYTYQWNLGNCTPSNPTTANPTVHCPYTGIFTYNFWVGDSIGCYSSFYGSINVNGHLPCNAYYNYHPTSTLGTYMFNDSTINPNFTYDWNFGDGTDTVVPTTTHAFPINGDYNVCLTVTDANAGCADTVCQNLYVQVCGTYAGIDYHFLGSTGDTVQFISTSTTQNPPLTYSWYFPNGTPSTSTLQNPVVSISGYQWFYLAVTDANGCSDTAWANIESGTGFNNVIYGMIETNGTFSCPAIVYLINEDSPGHLILVDSVFTRDSLGNCGGQYILPVPYPGLFYVKAALDPSSPNYSGFLPTYYIDTLHWADAQALNIRGYGGAGANINLIPGVNPGGPGFVSGYISQGAGLVAGNDNHGNSRSVGEPLNHIQINLLTISGQAVAYTYTDATGYYQFNDLAYGTYQLYAEALNKTAVPIIFTLSAQNPADSTANVSINSNTATSIKDIDGLQITRIYPNPINNIAELAIADSKPETATLKLVDLLGQTVLTGAANLVGGETTLQLEVSALSAGSYQLILQTKTKHAYYKVLIAR